MLKIDIVNDQIHLLPENDEVRECLRHKFPTIFFGNEIKMSADDFYNILGQLKWYIVNPLGTDDVFDCINPYPKWIYIIEPLHGSVKKKYFIQHCYNSIGSGETHSWRSLDSPEYLGKPLELNKKITIENKLPGDDEDDYEWCRCDLMQDIITIPKE